MFFFLSAGFNICTETNNVTKQPQLSNIHTRAQKWCHFNLTVEEWKSAQRHKHDVLAVVRGSQKFSHHRRPPSRGTGQPKFNQLEMVTSFTYRVQTQFGEDRCTRFRVIVVTDPQTQMQPQTYRQDRLQYTVPQPILTSEFRNGLQNAEEVVINPIYLLPKSLTTFQKLIIHLHSITAKLFKSQSLSHLVTGNAWMSTACSYILYPDQFTIYAQNG